MNSVIKIKKKYNLGEILSLIKKSSSEVISLHILENSDFLRDADNLALLKKYASSLGKRVEVVDNKNYKDLGFTLGEDIATKEVPHTIPSSKKGKLGFFNKIRFPKFTFKSKKVKVPSTKGKSTHKRLFVYLFLFFLFFTGVLGAVGWITFTRFYKASITLNQKSEIFSTVEEVLVKTPDSSPNIKGEYSLVLDSAEPIDLEVSDTITGPATGEKEIGDFAKGTLKIFNKTDKEKEIKSGEEVKIKIKKDDKEKEFVYLLEESVKVPAKTTQEITDDSGDTKKADVFGEKKVKIKAKEVGDSYNIKKGDVKSISFVDKDNDDYLLELDGDIKGGSSKKVTVVSDKDLSDLEDKLVKKLKKKVVEQLKSRVSDDKEFVSDAIYYKGYDKSFDKEVGEEAGEITLNMTVSVRALVFSKEELKKLLSEKISALIPPDFDLAENKDTITITSTAKETYTDDTGTFVAMSINSKIQSFIKPTLDVNSIKDNIAGKSVSDAENYLGSLKNIVRAVIEVKPSLPILSQRLPVNKDNIEIIIKSAD